MKRCNSCGCGCWARCGLCRRIMLCVAISCPLQSRAGTAHEKHFIAHQVSSHAVCSIWLTSFCPSLGLTAHVFVAPRQSWLVHSLEGKSSAGVLISRAMPHWKCACLFECIERHGMHQYARHACCHLQSRRAVAVICEAAQLWHKCRCRDAGVATCPW